MNTLETNGKLRPKRAMLADDEGITLTRRTMKHGWSLLWRVVIFVGACLGALTAQAEDAPMASMKTGRAASQAASMTEMMGAPGLVPFDIMSGQAGQWMVGYQFMFEKLDGNLVGTDEISEAKILERFAATPPT